MWWGRSNRRERSQPSSLLERLKALEASTTFGHVRAPGLVGWFTVGFACACIAGGLALLALLLVHPAQAEQSFGACSRDEPVRQAGRVAGVAERPANERTPSGHRPRSVSAWYTIGTSNPKRERCTHRSR